MSFRGKFRTFGNVFGIISKPENCRKKKTLFAIRFINQLKGTVSVISSDPLCKDTMPDVKIEPNKSLDI